MFYKTIIQGRLSFGTQKSYDKVIKMYEYRTETYYKSDILLNKEDVFDEVNLYLNVTRFVGNSSDKAFKNTLDLLQYSAQFAVSGSIQMWMIDEGKVIGQAIIEPNSDRAVVQDFIKGDDLFKKGYEQFSEAIKSFDSALAKFDKHAQAYERRGWVNLGLRNYSDALYDFNKSISLDESIAFAHYGKAIILLNEANYIQALEYLENTVRKSVALESLHWRARLKKAECHIELQEFDKAAFELKFFTSRKFEKGDPNIRRRAKAYALYGHVYYELGEHENAIAAIDKAFQQYTPDSKDFNEQESFYYKALAKKMLGKKDYLEDLKKASAAGFAPASELLSTIK